MNGTTLLIGIIMLIIFYPFFLYFQLNTFKNRLAQSWQKIEQCLATYNDDPTEALAEEIHQRRRAYNAIVRANNHKLTSKVAKFLSGKYNFEVKELFKFQGK